MPIDERHPLQGQSPYSASKIGADKMVEAFCRSFGVPAVTVRPFNTFGPRQSARPSFRRLSPSVWRAATCVRLGNLEPTRDMNFVRNTVDGFLAAAAADQAIGETINLASGREISIGDLAGLIAHLIGAQVTLASDAERLRPEKSEVSRLLGDSALARRLLGWEPAVSLEDGLRRTIDWITPPLHKYRPDVLYPFLTRRPAPRRRKVQGSIEMSETPAQAERDRHVETEVSVVMPTFNEERALPLVVADIRKQTAGYGTEIVIVDSSSDGTAAAAEALGVRVISQPPRGHGIALRTAILAASGDYIVTADCDNTYPMDMIPHFIDLLSKEGFDLVSGNRLGTREVRKAMPLANLWANRLFRADHPGALPHRHARRDHRHVRFSPPGRPCDHLGDQFLVSRRDHHSLAPGRPALPGSAHLLPAPGGRGHVAPLAERQGVLPVFSQVPLRSEDAGGEAMKEYPKAKGRAGRRRSLRTP